MPPHGNPIDPEKGRAPEAERPDPQRLLLLARARMPFGKYRGRLLCDVPEAYLAWFARKGFPAGRLGECMRELLEIKANGLAPLLRPLRPKAPPEGGA